MNCFLCAPAPAAVCQPHAVCRSCFVETAPVNEEQRRECRCCSATVAFYCYNVENQYVGGALPEFVCDAPPPAAVIDALGDGEWIEERSALGRVVCVRALGATRSALSVLCPFCPPQPYASSAAGQGACHRFKVQTGAETYASRCGRACYTPDGARSGPFRIYVTSRTKQTPDPSIQAAERAV